MKKTCLKCIYWAGEGLRWTGEGYRHYKCYVGDCPAKLRDEKEKKKYWMTVYSAAVDGTTPEVDVETLLRKTRAACILFTKDGVRFRVSAKIEILE